MTAPPDLVWRCDQCGRTGIVELPATERFRGPYTVGGGEVCPCGAVTRVRERGSGRWTKADIARMCGQLDTFALLNKPIAGPASVFRAAEEALRAALAKQRGELVIAGLRSAREASGRYYREECEVIGNALVRRVHGDATDELVRRKIEEARAEDEAHRKLDALVLRVHREGIPPEVVAYDPIERTKTRMRL